MEFFTGLVLGVIVGAVIMFFVFNNNKKKMSALNDTLEKKVKQLQDEIKKGK